MGTLNTNYEQVSKLSTQARQALHQFLVSQHTVQSCINCEFMDKKQTLCTLYKAQPPIQVIVFGCEKWEGEIPF